MSEYKPGTIVTVDPSGMGLTVILSVPFKDDETIMYDSFSFAMDARGEPLETFIGAMARRILELEKELASLKESDDSA